MNKNIIMYNKIQTHGFVHKEFLNLLIQTLNTFPFLYLKLK